MSKFVVMYHFHEIQETRDGEYICEYKKDLPHAKEIVKSAVDDWNKTVKAFIPFLYTEFDDDIASVRAYPSRTDTDAMCIEVRLKPKIRMSEKKRKERRLKKRSMPSFLMDGAKVFSEACLKTRKMESAIMQVDRKE